MRAHVTLDAITYDWDKAGAITRDSNARWESGELEITVYFTGSNVTFGRFTIDHTGRLLNHSAPDPATARTLDALARIIYPELL
jgi:hypothetical protein